MKTASIAIAALALCASIDRASAVSACTEADAQVILTLTGQILIDENCLDDMMSECPNAKCYVTLQKVAKQMPNCVADGTNPKATFDQLVKDCKSSSGSSTTTTTTPSTTTKTPSTTTKAPSTTTKTTAPTTTSDSTETTETPASSTPSPSGVSAITFPTSSPDNSKSAASSLSISAGIALASAVVAAAMMAL